jgi:hypothetical protein
MVRLAVIVVVLLTALIPGLTVPVAAAPAGTTYALPTVSETPTICSGVECDTFTAKYDYNGDGNCSACQPSDPYRVGNFSLTLVGSRFQPSDPYKAKSGTGTLTVIWADSTTTLANYNFKAKDSKTYTLIGKVTGGTSTRFATGTAVGGQVGLPTDPFLPSTTSGAVRFG